MSSFADLRRMMVDCQLRTYDVTDRAVLAAADSVPREVFFPGDLAHLAYLDQAVALPGTTRALSAPMVVARMIQALELKAGERALEYAGGSGYGAQASLCEPDAAALALARAAFGQPGLPAVTMMAELPAKAQFDVVLVGGACETQPSSLFGHVAPGGRLIAIEGLGRAARVILYRHAGDTLTGRPVFDAAAPALREFRKAEEFVF